MKRLLTLSCALTLAAALFAGGCVEQLDEIDRTQANALRKADLYGVWYRLATVTDMPRSGSFGFVGQVNFGGDGGKVVFDIQEKYLVVYPFTEKVKDGDAKWHRKKIRNYWDEGRRDEFVELLVGNPVAMFPIESHFDIIRDYSTSTGAQTNVKVENTTDRPWYERKYFRVDWMGNTFGDFFFPAGSVAVSSVDYYVQEHEKDDPNRFYMEWPKGKDGKPDKKRAANYFHFTRRLYGKPASTGACSTYSLSFGDCSSAVFDVRVSFRRADPRSINDFEIRDYHNTPDADKFGFFLAQRYTFDENYGLTYTGHDYKAQIWNLWQKSKTFTPVKDADGRTIACLTNYDCKKPAVCDQEDWFKQGVCAVGKPIEYRDRGIRPIVYHMSADHPQAPSTLRALYRVADNWSKVFKETVSWLYFWQDKWSRDGLTGFEDAQSLFGQRFCKTHLDCANHQGVLAAGDVKVPPRANILAVGTSKGVITAIDDLDKRGKVGGGAMLFFVNASPDVAKATLKVGTVSVPDVAFKTGAIDAHTQSALLPKADVSDRMNLTVEAGGKTITVANARVRKNRIHWVVFLGGDRVAIANSTLTKEGVRLFDAIQQGTAKNPAGKEVSTGPVLEAGLNGVREKGLLAYGRFSDYVHFTGNTAAAVFLKPGSRSDVNCQQIKGVGVCTGWKQTLSSADRAARVKIRDEELPDIFVMCTNLYSGKGSPEACGTADERAKALNDCRYWTKDAKSGIWHNPCRKFVPDPDKPKLIGDARYSFAYWVTNAHAGSPLGYGPSAADPDTGQLFWGTANIYGAPLTTYGNYGKDLVDLLNGDLDVDSLISGQYIKSYLRARLQAGIDHSEFEAAKWEKEHQADLPADYYGTAKAAKRASKTAAELVLGRKVDDKQLGRLAKAIRSADKDSQLQKMVALEDPRKLAEKFMNEEPTFDEGEIKQRWDRLKGTSIERALINEEMALALSKGEVQPGDAISPEMLARISPAGWAAPHSGMNEHRRMQFLGIHNIFPAEFADPALIGMAERLKCDPGEEPTTNLEQADSIGKKVCYKGSALRVALQNAIYRGVIEHELGHTFGLRHNFSASADVLNYFDPYYDVREKEPVYCASITTPFGSVVANDLCEQTLGETCKYLSCAQDSDCPSGYTCGSGSCIDKDSVKVGTCEGTVDTYFSCSSDDDCASAGGVCRPDGWCGTRVGCATETDCASGELCSGGACVDQVSGQARTKVLVHSEKKSLKKYMPRAAPTPTEIKNRRTEFQYSSIMDYGQKINSDLRGLGKYDKAAIKYGYGRLLEVFADTSFMRHQLDKYAKNTSQTPQQSAWRMRTSMWRYAGSITHPFMYLNNWMSPEYLKKRDTVPAFWVAAEPNIAQKYGRSIYDTTYFEVPYKYCSDEYRGGSLACYYFDTGAHMQEIVYHAAQQMKEYYVFDAFKRERMWMGYYGNPTAYMSRIQDRYMTPIIAAARYYAVYNNIFRIYSFFPFYDNHPMYMRGLKDASEQAFRELTNVLASPAPGSYKFDAAKNEYVNFDFTEGRPGSQLDIPVGDGKLPWTTFATENGYYYAQHPLWIGSMWDKLAAIFSMVNSSASFLTDFVGEQLPLFRGTAIGFNTLYPRELSEVLGGVAAGSIEEIGGYVRTAQDGKLHFEPRNPFEPVDPTLPRVAPSINNLTLRLWAATMSIVNLPAGFDPSFTDSMAVWLKGGSESYDFGGSTLFDCASHKGSAVCYEQWRDPFGDKIYVVPRPNYSKDSFSPTYAVVKRLKKMTEQYQATTGTKKTELGDAIKREREILDYFRTLYKLYGSIAAQ